MVGGMACYGTVLMDSRGGLHVLFVSFTKGPGGFPYVFIITAKVVALVPVYGTTLVEHRVLVLRGDQKVFDGFATLEVSLDAISTTDPFDTFAKTLCVGYDNVTLTLHSMVGRLGRIVAPIIDLSGRPVKSFLARNIKESIYIRVNNPSLNNNIGKFNLSHIWDRVLLNTKGLTLK